MRAIKMRNSVLVLIFCITLAGARSAAADCSVTTFGAVADDGHDDRLAFQAAIDVCAMVGGAVSVPTGTFDISRAGSAYYGLRVQGVTLHGAGPSTVLRQTAATAPSVRLLRVVGAGVVVHDMTLDGRKVDQTVSEHRHGVFVDHGEGTLIHDVIARNFSGDGFYVYTGSVGTVFRRVRAFGNNRNGITFGGGVVNGIEVHDSEFTDNAVQQIDSEGTSTNDVLIRGCLLDGVRGNDFALTISGSRATARSERWRVHGNEIRGAVFVVWANDVEISGNWGLNPTTKASVNVYRYSSNVTVSDNVLSMSQTTIPYLAAVRVEGTGPTDMPTDIIVRHNVLKVAHADQFAVRATGAVRVLTEENVVRGIIYYRATIPTVPSSGVVHGNLMTGYRQDYSGGAVFDPPVAVSDNLLLR